MKCVFPPDRACLVLDWLSGLGFLGLDWLSWGERGEGGCAWGERGTGKGERAGREEGEGARGATVAEAMLAWSYH